MLEKIGVRHPWPIIVGLFILFISGSASWMPSAKIIEILTRIAIATCVLLWAILDAQDRKMRLGNWQGLAILLLSPIGMLIWFIRTRGWGFFLPYVIYWLLLIVGLLLSLVSYLLTGMCFGYTFSELIHYV